jgi:hypothetical protein
VTVAQGICLRNRGLNMFEYFRKKKLLEQKKMIWQNFFASSDFIKILEEEIKKK